MLGLGKKKVYDLAKMEKQLKRKLSANRFQHTIGVTYTAAALAMRYETELNKTMCAGLLHDCAKYMSGDELIKNCERYNIEITEAEKRNPSLLHAKVGAVIAAKKYHVHDKEIFNAILHHTTGSPDMTLLDKIIFVADYIEPNREPLPDIDEIRKQAFMNIDRALVMILKATLAYLRHMETEIDETTQKTHDFFVSKLQA
ncbi:MAG: bis(5'-nucleosyl)-tetraphosphatase (symmetrical) YqeK [Lachnospiraceae bacterium]|nr:bis(5'-nucleosyl)-tetraphosphatase (symmetrical) YqeK [Lachnospiraceae bacterium]